MGKTRAAAIFVGMDALSVPAAVWLALYLRFEGKIPAGYFSTGLKQLPVFILIVLCVHFAADLYNRIWRYAGSAEGIVIVLSIAADGILWLGYSVMAGTMLPRSIYFMAAVLLLLLAGGDRFSIRIYSYAAAQYIRLRSMNRAQAKNVMLFGAGDAGAMIMRELYGRSDKKRRVVGIIDDDPRKTNNMFFGVRILGTREILQASVIRYGVGEIFITMPSVKGEQLRKIINICRQTGAQVKILPGIYEFIDGEIHIDQLRPIAIEDLLGREAVHLDDLAVKQFLRHKTILVTGAGGSIGAEICRQIAVMEPAELLLLGKGENSIYEIERELTVMYPALNIFPIVADVRDRERIRGIMREFHPQLVFHAAAHKHVPLMEYQPMEAIRNNVLGTKVIAEEASNAGAEKFVMISTDKAVNPTSVMGCTKKIAEMVVQSMNCGGTGTKYAVVRFGNVLGSRGSVVPLFQKQIARGGPVTVTDPEIKRYFMTIPEASQLVLQSGAMAEGGEVFVLDMGKPVRILDLARDLIVLSGMVPDEDIKIKFTGLRPGEKLFEELLNAEEGIKATENKKIFTAHIKPADRAEVDRAVGGLLQERESSRIISDLQNIVPSYHPNRKCLSVREK